MRNVMATAKLIIDYAECPPFVIQGALAGINEVTLGDSVG